MLIIENIALAINGLWSNKMRALLTMLGIIIGIGSVIAIVTVGNSMTRGLSEEMQSFGANNLDVYVQQKPQEEDEAPGGDMVMMGMMGSAFSSGFYRSPEEKDLLSYDLIDRYKDTYKKEVQYVALSEYMQLEQAKAGKKTAQIRGSGVNVDGLLAKNLNLISGRLLNEKDMDSRRHNIVVADLLCKDLFGNEDPVGKTIDIAVGGTKEIQTFYIVGVYEQKAAGGAMYSMNGSTTTEVYIPISLAKSINNAEDGFQSMTVVTTVGTNANDFSEETNKFFEKQYAKNKNFYAVSSSMQSMVDQMTDMFKTISLAISAIAGISLLVGGIGVMNIMLVSITERTREIGTRKALGATNGSIRIQFIVESIIICLIGGVIGIGLGVALGAAGAKLVGYTAQADLTIIMIAVSFSMAIGVFFGYYPANKAAKLDPIEALRYE